MVCAIRSGAFCITGGPCPIRWKQANSGRWTKMRTSAPIRIVVHWPETEAGKRELARRAADVHADFVLSTICGLDCPATRKRELLQAVLDIIQANKEEKE